MDLLRLITLLKTPLNSSNVIDTVSEVEAYQGYLLEQIDLDSTQRTKLNRYLRAIEKKLSWGQTVARGKEAELKRSIAP